MKKVIFIWLCIFFSCQKENNLKLTKLANAHAILERPSKWHIELLGINDFSTEMPVYYYDNNLNVVYVNNFERELLVIDNNNGKIKNKLIFKTNEIPSAQYCLEKRGNLIVFNANNILMLLSDDIQKGTVISDSIYRIDNFLFNRKYGDYTFFIKNDSISIEFCSKIFRKIDCETFIFKINLQNLPQPLQIESRNELPEPPPLHKQ